MLLKTTLRSFLILSALTFSGAVQASNLAIYQTVSQTVGTDPVITGGGSHDNTNLWSVGTVGQFIMFDTTTSSYLGMVVSATAPTGALAASTDSLMVARTVNSQGLTDNGTLSVFVFPTTTGAWSLTLGFGFFQVVGAPGSFTITSTPQSVGLQLTSLDIDFNQKYYTKNSDFTSNTTYAPTSIASLGTDTSATGGTGYRGFTAAGDSTFSNPQHAVSSKGVGSSYTVQMAHNSQALFMYEFRDPSLVVPEPSALFLAGFGALVLSFTRRVRKTC